MKFLRLFLASWIIGSFLWIEKGVANLGFQNIGEAELRDITQDLAANFSHRSITGAKSLGSVFGFEANLVGGMTTSSRIDKISKNSGAGGLANLYTAGLLLGVSVPFGFTFEGLLLPSLSSSQFNFGGYSVGVRWLMNDLVPVLPINLSLRYNWSSTRFGFNQNLGGGLTGEIKSDTSVQEIGLYLSPNLPLVEPYLGVATVSSRGSLEFTGTGNIFNTSFSVSNSASTTVSSTKTVIGLSLLMPFFSFGVEYVTLFGTSGYGLKLGVSF
ncbi:MAG: hypothetical protein NZ480_03205 [Bdellovibrionaceae bacterium]|nr:hypothetical protein [Pseudobdellovibrionaceae bacterium]MDW8189919.1 hypothetical protein [Pseudobdellovibrionaceae bacterium]